MAIMAKFYFISAYELNHGYMFIKLIKLQNLIAALPINLIFWIIVASVCLWVVREFWVRIANVVVRPGGCAVALILNLVGLDGEVAY